MVKKVSFLTHQKKSQIPKNKKPPRKTVLKKI